MSFLKIFALALACLHFLAKEPSTVGPLSQVLDTAVSDKQKVKEGISIDSVKQAIAPTKIELDNYKEPLDTSDLSKETSEGLKNQEILMTTTRMTAEVEFDWERLLLEQKIQNQKNTQYAIIAFIAVLLIILFILYRYYKAKAIAIQLLQTQRDKINQQKIELESLDSTKSRFFANISHEFRTPLTLISAPLKNLPKEEIQKLPVTCQQDLQLMQRNTEKLQVLVDDILNLSKLELGELELKMKTTPIREFIGRVWSNYESLARQLNIDYRLEISALPNEPVRLDVSKTEKVISNLLSNAIKHTPAGSSVQLEAEQCNDRLLIRVIDKGYGIAEEDLPYIFDRYFQSKQPDAPIQGGTGIGLSLAKEYTKHMAGELTVERSRRGKGSVFLLDLPYEPGDVGAIEMEPTLANDTMLTLIEEAPVSKDSGITEADKHKKILVVEDNEDMQHFIKRLLQEQYQVNTSLNGKQALNMLEKESYDLIISDVMMPEMDGFTLLNKLRETEVYQSLPVIMLTALSGEEHKLKALSRGVDDYLVKPFSPSELLARVANMLTRQQVKLQTQATVEDLDHQVSGNVRTKDDLELITEVEKVIVTEMENEEFKLEDMAEHFHLSTRQLHRRIKQITGLSPKEYQRDVALQKARKLLEDEIYNNLSAVGYSVGIRNTTRFAQYYETRFGKDPRDFFKINIQF